MTQTLKYKDITEKIIGALLKLITGAISNLSAMLNKHRTIIRLTNYCESPLSLKEMRVGQEKLRWLRWIGAYGPYFSLISLATFLIKQESSSTILRDLRHNLMLCDTSYILSTQPIRDADE
jgi:hypothetical protein